MKAACALLKAGDRRGTGFLVSAERLLTSNHVVCQVGETLIQVNFSHGNYEARVELADDQNDCALLRLTRPVPASDAQPLVITTEQVQRNDEWEGYGFPAATEQAGLLVDGRIQDPRGQDRTLRPALVLQSASVTAGSELGGFSGSPVLANGQVIGQMRSIIPDQTGGAQMAVVYACPAGPLMDLARQRLGAEAFSALTPNRGLSALQPADAHLSFGRKTLTAKLIHLFRRRHEPPGDRRRLTEIGERFVLIYRCYKYLLLLALAGALLVLVPLILIKLNNRAKADVAKHSQADRIIQENVLVDKNLNLLQTTLESFAKEPSFDANALAIAQNDLKKTMNEQYRNFNDHAWWWFASLPKQAALLQLPSRERNSLDGYIDSYRQNLIESVHALDAPWGRLLKPGVTVLSPSTRDVLESSRAKLNALSVQRRELVAKMSAVFYVPDQQ